MKELVAETPINYVTKVEYQGNNIDRLLASQFANNFSQNKWATYRQWLSVGERVIKGQHGTPIAVFGVVKETEDKKDESKVVPFRSAYVFNIEQVEKIKELK